MPPIFVLLLAEAASAEPPKKGRCFEAGRYRTEELDWTALEELAKKRARPFCLTLMLTVLGGHKDRVARGDLLADVHRLLRRERKSLPSRFANLGFDCKDRFEGSQRPVLQSAESHFASKVLVEFMGCPLALRLIEILPA